MPGPRRSSRQPRPAELLDAGPLGADIASFRLHLAAEGKSARTVQGYTAAVRWFAAGHLLSQAGKTSWDQADARDIQQWTVHLLDRYSSAYASIQFRALRQFFKWRAAEEQCPDPMTRLRAPLTAGGIYQAVTRRGRQCGVTVYPHRFRHHFSHTWLDRGGAERDLMELNGWTSPQMLTRYGASARAARARRSYDRIMDNST